LGTVCVTKVSHFPARALPSIFLRDQPVVVALLPMVRSHSCPTAAGWHRLPAQPSSPYEIGLQVVRGRMTRASPSSSHGDPAVGQESSERAALTYGTVRHRCLARQPAAASGQEQEQGREGAHASAGTAVADVR
jgi:hypothetical protein